MNWSDLFLIIVNVIGIIIAVVVYCVPKGHVKSHNDTEMKKHGILLAKVWLRSSIVWIEFHYWLTANAILTTLLIPFLFDEESKVRVCVYSACSLLATIVPMVINFRKYSSVYSEAFNILNDSLEAGDARITSAIKEGEHVIAQIQKGI